MLHHPMVREVLGFILNHKEGMIGYPPDQKNKFHNHELITAPPSFFLSHPFVSRRASAQAQALCGRMPMLRRPLAPRLGDSVLFSLVPARRLAGHG